MFYYGGFLMVALAAPVKAHPTGFIIDFGPAKWTADSEIVVHWEAADGTAFDQSVTVLDSDATPAFVRDLVAKSVLFGDSFRHRRCLVPADGFYERRTVNKKKMPISLPSRPLSSSSPRSGESTTLST